MAEAKQDNMRKLYLQRDLEHKQQTYRSRLEGTRVESESVEADRRHKHNNQ